MIEVRRVLVSGEPGIRLRMPSRVAEVVSTAVRVSLRCHREGVLQPDGGPVLASADAVAETDPLATFEAEIAADGLRSLIDMKVTNDATAVTDATGRGGDLDVVLDAEQAWAWSRALNLAHLTQRQLGGDQPELDQPQADTQEPGQDEPGMSPLAEVLSDLSVAILEALTTD